nr:hypothetical protein [Burkholderia ambifaria]
MWIEAETDWGKRIDAMSGTAKMRGKVHGLTQYEWATALDPRPVTGNEKALIRQGFLKMVANQGFEPRICGL